MGAQITQYCSENEAKELFNLVINWASKVSYLTLSQWGRTTKLQASVI
jgi:hypothetical protein